MTPTFTDITGLGACEDSLGLPPAEPVPAPPAGAPPAGGSAAAETGGDAAPGAEGPAPEATSRRRGGPKKSPRAQAASARNAIRDGMRSTSLFPLHFEPIIAEKRATLTAAHRPTNPREHDLVLEMARAEAQIEAAEAAKLLDLVRIKDRAEFAWDIDQNTYVNALGARLPKDSHHAVRALEGTRHGVLFLLEIWDELSGIVSAQGKLTDDQRTTLCNVMGLPPELREGNPRVPAADDGRALSELIASHIRDLESLLEESLDGLDAYNRACAIDGYAFHPDRETQRQRRNEALAYQRRNRALRELQQLRSEGAPATAAATSGAAATPREPDLPERPVPSADAQRFMRDFAMSALTDSDMMRYEASQVLLAKVRAECSAATAAAPAPAPVPAPGPAAAMPPAPPEPAPARTQAVPLSNAQRRKREHEDRVRERARQKKGRRMARRKKKR